MNHDGSLGWSPNRNSQLQHRTSARRKINSTPWQKKIGPLLYRHLFKSGNHFGSLIDCEGPSWIGRLSNEIYQDIIKNYSRAKCNFQIAVVYLTNIAGMTTLHQSSAPVLTGFIVSFITYTLSELFSDPESFKVCSFDSL